MDLYLTADDPGRGLAWSIAEKIRQAIAEGRLGSGDLVPPSRELARQLAVSRHTVTTAYGYLVAEGYLEGARGGGTRVTAAGGRRGPLGGLRKGVPTEHRLAGLTPLAAEDAPRLHLWLGVPDGGLFPFDEWRRELGRSLRDVRDAGAHYGDAAGDPLLRAAIAAWIQRSRGVRADAGQVVVTAGAQQAFDLVIGALTRPGDAIAVEDPGYPPFRNLARARGARIVPIPVDGQGLVVDALPSGVKLVCVTPSHQFPLGTVLSLGRRRQLLAWAHTSGAFIVEDDYDSEFRFAGRPLEPLQRLDAAERVLYVGTVSKTLSPALRIGFLIAPPPLVPRLAGLRQLVDWHSPAIVQRALARFLAGGAMDRHVRRARRVYQARHQLLVDWFASPGRHLGRIIQPGAGLHVAVDLRPGLDEQRLIDGARTAGLAIEGLAKYAVTSGRRGLALGFGGATAQEMAKALRILGQLPPPRRRHRQS